MLDHHSVTIRGAVVALVGCGMVGRPLAMMLLQRDATVLCCNKHTQDIRTLTRQADIVIAAAGSPKLVKQDWIKPGAVIIDVGINSIPDDTRKTGYRLVGDVDFEQVSQMASAISPVPGGVGPMTVAMLMKAVVQSWERKIERK